MRHKFFILTIALAAVLTSCNRHESAITGSYGSNVLSGQVVMASEMADAGPAGVEVSVVGTGMSATLAADGAFMFVGVPANAVLSFRRSDGINARLSVAPGHSLTVELSSVGAKVTSSRRRSAAPKANPESQYEGLVVTAAADSITVHDSHGADVTLAIDDATVIRKGNTPVLATDLKTGDRVHVKGVKKGDTLTATQIIVQNEDDGDDSSTEPKEFEGTVVTAAADTLTIHDSHGNDVTFAIDSKTIVTKGNKPVDPATLVTGDRVHVRATKSGDTLTALVVIVQQTEHSQPDEMEVSGTAKSIGADSLLVSTHKGDVTVTTDTNTVVKRDGQTASLSDIKIGDQVSAEGTAVDATTMLAKEIDARSSSKGKH